MFNDTNSTAPFDTEEIRTQALTNFILSGVLTSIICIGGLIGNSLSAIVLTRPGWKSSTTCILLGLTLSDSICLGVVLIAGGLPHIAEYACEACVKWLESVLIPTYSFFTFAGTAGQFGSIYFTVAITIERYIAVCYPLRARHICTWANARYCVAGVFIWTVLINLVKLWEIEAVTIPPNENVTGFSEEIQILRHTEFFRSKEHKIWEIFYTFVLQFSIPLVIIITLNIKIYLQIQLVNKARLHLTSQQKDDIAIAKVLIVVVVVFLISHLGKLSDVIHRMFFNTTSELWIRISDFLYTINSSVNFIIYVFGGGRFRAELFRILVSKFPFLKNVLKIPEPISRENTTQKSTTSTYTIGESRC